MGTICLLFSSLILENIFVKVSFSISVSLSWSFSGDMKRKREMFETMKGRDVDIVNEN